MSNGLNQAKAILILLLAYCFWVILCWIATTSIVGCSSTTMEFNTEDMPNPDCFATYGSMMGYCSSNAIDVFNNNHLYDGAE